MSDEKNRARSDAFARRQAARSEAAQAAAVAHLLAEVLPHKGCVLSGYMPIRTEIDPVPVMAAMAAFGPVVVPVIEAAEKPLRFRRWSPGCKMIDGPFGAKIPETGDWLTPVILIVPLVAFDARCMRLGYGGGFYDRTLETLRAAGPVTALGFAFAGQQSDLLPVEPTDQPLDGVVTEDGILWR